MTERMFAERADVEVDEKAARSEKFGTKSTDRGRRVENLASRLSTALWITGCVRLACAPRARARLWEKRPSLRLAVVRIVGGGKLDVRVFGPGVTELDSVRLGKLVVVLVVRELCSASGLASSTSTAST